MISCLREKLFLLSKYNKFKRAIYLLPLLLVVLVAFNEGASKFAMVKEKIVGENTIFVSLLNSKLDGLVSLINSEEEVHGYKSVNLYLFDGDVLLDQVGDLIISESIIKEISSGHYRYFQEMSVLVDDIDVSDVEHLYTYNSPYSTDFYITISVPIMDNFKLSGVRFVVVEASYFNKELELYGKKSDYFPALVSHGFDQENIIIAKDSSISFYSSPDFNNGTIGNGGWNSKYSYKFNSLVAKGNLAYAPLSLWVVQDWGAIGFYKIFPLYGYIAIFLSFLFSIYFAKFLVRLEREERIETNDLFDDAIGATAQGFLFYCSDGSIVKINSVAESLLGNTVNYNTMDDFLGYMFDHAAILDQSVLMNLNKTSANSRNVYDFREVIITENDVMCLVQAQQAAKGGAVIILTDISDFSRLEDNILNLNKKNYQLISAVEATDIGIVITDPRQEGNPVIFVNEAYIKTSHIDKNKIIAKSFSDVLRLQCGLQKSETALSDLADKKNINMEYQSVEKDVSEWHGLRVSPIYDSKNVLELFIVFLSDITNVKIKESQFIQSQKLESMGQISAGVAHDFNNILSIVDGYARMVDTKVDDEVVKEYIERIRQASDRGASLTRQLLTFGKHKVVVESVLNISQAIDENKPLLKPLLDASIDMSVEVLDDDLCVECAPDSFSQIIMNLVINARDAISGGGSIKIDISKVDLHDVICNKPDWVEEGNYVCLSVIDNGSGMDEETKKKIFDPFFSTKEQGKGTGLGLSMVYGIIKQIKGFIDVETKLMEGTNMKIYLPLTNKTPSKNIKSDDDGKISLDGYTILVAEDEVDLLCIVKNMLEEMGMTVLTASNGNDALVVQEEFEDKIDFLLTDIVMPELNGVKLAELFEAVRPDTKIVFMSGYPAKGDMAKAELPEKAVFLAKPLKYEKLAKILYEKASGKEGENGEDTVYWQTGTT